MLGESGFTLTCCVIGADRLNPFIIYQWTKDNGTQTQIQDGSNPRTVSFHPLRVSDAGRYTCQATISSASLSNDIVWSASHDVRVSSEFTNVITVPWAICHCSGSFLTLSIIELLLIYTIPINGSMWERS